MDSPWYRPLSRSEAEVFVLSEGYRAVLRSSSVSFKCPDVFALTYVTTLGVRHTLLKQEPSVWRVMDLDRYERVLPTEVTFETLDHAIQAFTA